MSRTPLQIDHVVTSAAVDAGLTDVYRRRIVRVDTALLPPQYFRKTPDYNKIRQQLEDGVVIPGCSLTDDYEYILSPGPKEI